jgi:hypothetical protein
MRGMVLRKKTTPQYMYAHLRCRVFVAAIGGGCEGKKRLAAAAEL